MPSCHGKPLLGLTLILCTHAEMSNSSARISMHEVEYSLTLFRPCR